MFKIARRVFPSGGLSIIFIGFVDTYKIFYYLSFFVHLLKVEVKILFSNTLGSKNNGWVVTCKLIHFISIKLVLSS